MKIYLVDGTWELFRAYFGAPKAQANGVEVGAVRGLLRSLNALLADATHVACAFDTTIESFRNELFDGYKTAEGVPEDLLAQFSLAEEACEALGVTRWGMVEFEADDAIATAATAFAAHPEVEQVIIATPDKDLAQCVQGERVIQWDRQRGALYDEVGVREKFGVGPRSIPDLLGLVGDAADGLPGLKGWGMKSAATVLAAYERIEDIPADPSIWTVKVRGAARLSETLEAERDAAMLYKRLATLRDDVPLELAPEALAWQGADRDKLVALCERLEERRLLDRVRLWKA